MKVNPVPPLNKAQLDLLMLFNRNLSDEELEQIKAYFIQFFAKRAMNEADKAWTEKGYEARQENDFLNDHLRASEN